MRVDTVRAGPVPDRAAILTGRRRTGLDRTEQRGGPLFLHRTDGGRARAGPRGPPMAAAAARDVSSELLDTVEATAWSRSAMAHTWTWQPRDVVAPARGTTASRARLFLGRFSVTCK